MIADLLELCGYKSPELERELPRVEEAFGILGLTAEDVERGEERLNRFFEIELEGVRRILGIPLRELVDLVLAKQEKKKVLYASIPAVGVDYLTAAMLHSGEVRIAFPDVLFCEVMGSMFDKLGPILEAGEQLYLPPGVGHCSLLQVRAGIHALGLIPRGDVFFSSGTVCDEVLKADELLGEYFGVPIHYVNRCQDKEWEESTRVDREIKFFAEQLRRAEAKVAEIVGFELTDDMMRRARDFKRTYSRPLRKLLELVATADPPPLSATILPLMRELNTMCISRRGTEAAAEAINILNQELEQRVSQGTGVVPKGAPRIMHGYVTSISDPTIVYLLEKAGMAVPVVELQLFDGGGFTPVLVEGIEDRRELQASAYTQGAIGNSLPTRIRSIVEACKRLSIDGIFCALHHSCRPILAEGLMVKDAVTKELGIPFMLLESDVYDSRFYTVQQMRASIETFAEMLKASSWRKRT